MVICFSCQFQFGQSVFLIEADIIFSQTPFFPCGASFRRPGLDICGISVKFLQSSTVRRCLRGIERYGYSADFSFAVVQRSCLSVFSKEGEGIYSAN